MFCGNTLQKYIGPSQLPVYIIYMAVVYHLCLTPSNQDSKIYRPQNIYILKFNIYICDTELPEFFYVIIVIYENELNRHFHMDDFCVQNTKYELYNTTNCVALYVHHHCTV